MSRLAVLAALVGVALASSLPGVEVLKGRDKLFIQHIAVHKSRSSWVLVQTERLDKLSDALTRGKAVNWSGDAELALQPVSAQAVAAIKKSASRRATSSPATRTPGRASSSSTSSAASRSSRAARRSACFTSRGGRAGPVVRRDGDEGHAGGGWAEVHHQVRRHRRQAVVRGRRTDLPAARWVVCVCVFGLVFVCPS